MVQKLLYRVKDLLEILNSLDKEIGELNQIMNSLFSNRSYFQNIKKSLLMEIDMLEQRKQDLLSVKVTLKSIHSELEKQGIKVEPDRIKNQSNSTQDITIDNSDIERTLEKIQSTRKERKVYRY